MTSEFRPFSAGSNAASAVDAGGPAELERGGGDADSWEGRSVWESDGPLALGAK
jgi:hypothetical protein